jgi:oligoribonuclease NrnB/cAMP/cGMP phosphodiesterase (DHH superfamily)
MLAWNHFHPDSPAPRLLAYVEDDDIFRFALPETKPFMTYLIIQPLDFVLWDEIARKLEDDDERASLLQKSSAYREYFEYLAEQAVEKAKLVSFEGYEIYFATAHPHKTMKSLIGNKLARKKGPLALVVSAHPKGYGVSIRGDGSVDVAKIAERFGGNGHPNSAGFAIPREGPFPWELIEDDENTRD